MRPTKIADQSDRNHWLKTRFEYITASECGAVMGVNKYQSAHELFVKKVSRVREPENHHMRRGKEWESKILDIYRSKHGKARPMTAMYTHPDYPWLACSPDAISCSKVIEIKAPARDWTKVPEYYRYQVLCQQLIMGKKDGILVQGIPEEEYLSDHQHALKPNVIYKKVRIWALVFTDKERSDFLNKTYRFHCSLKKGYLYLDLW